MHFEEPIRVALVDSAYFPVYQDTFSGIREALDSERNVRVQLVKRQPTLEKTLQSFRGQGVLGTFVFPDNLLTLKKRNLKAVSILRGNSPVPAVTMDQRESGRRVARHLLERGHQRIGYFAAGHQSYSPRYEQGVQEACDEAGIAYSLFLIGPRTHAKGKWRIEDQYADLLDWLQEEQLTAVATADEEHARRILDVGPPNGIRVPEDLAICSCMGNPNSCEFTDPPLSALHSDMKSVGAEAFRLLLAWIRNPHTPPPQETILNVGTLRVRRSSDQHAVRDALIRKALTYIDLQLEENPGVLQVAEACGCSRSTLERKFQQFLGYTPAHAIRLFRERRAYDLIRHSTLPFQEITFRCGLTHTSQLSRLMREAYQSTPGEIRHSS